MMVKKRETTPLRSCSVNTRRIIGCVNESYTYSAQLCGKASPLLGWLRERGIWGRSLGARGGKLKNHLRNHAIVQRNQASEDLASQILSPNGYTYFIYLCSFSF